MTANDDQYVPDEMDARGCFLDGAAGAFVREDWEAFLARVRRDAAREALDGLAEQFNNWAEVTAEESARTYRDTHYPEEHPVTEQQTDWDDEDADVCGETYDHEDETTYEDDELRQWTCRLCGAEGWDDK